MGRALRTPRGRIQAAPAEDPRLAMMFGSISATWNPAGPTPTFFRPGNEPADGAAPTLFATGTTGGGAFLGPNPRSGHKIQTRPHIEWFPQCTCISGLQGANAAGGTFPSPLSLKELWKKARTETLTTPGAKHAGACAAHMMLAGVLVVTYGSSNAPGGGLSVGPGRVCGLFLNTD